LNYKQKAANGNEVLPNSEWITPVFAQIKEKRTKRLSPYTESELWERDEILTIIKYEPRKRNKAASKIPYQSKTGTGPVLLRSSFLYVRDWLNEHPFKNEPNARLISNLLTGGPIEADTSRTVMTDLKSRITYHIRAPSKDKKMESLLYTSLSYDI
jgi:integrase/recombinase XerD